ncbi:methyltransferase domain-containing protein [Altererythrobacter sp. SALINAS58]|uniref:methyltransferase domain-containing protein n=1 Tax=Alteripontixanthobacter muriae TaxID=2705546 RepID=UPI00157681AB|nr:methyltransferase domain-containing protein [Alteripontixanthobacter muriae]NTZ42256.1 methyltransferase domain-containing protein [Alteripontixanthobacter muriae]
MTGNSTGPDPSRGWDDFWTRDRRQRRGGGCLPGGASGIEDVQKREWQGFAKNLPRKSRILDLATGDGRVMRWIAAVRPDARLVGVDQAMVLPEPPRGSKVRAGIAIESLPFSDCWFDAIVSQFGFEYADMEQAAQEIARALKPGGVAALLTHRPDSPIVAHNRARRHQISWALDEAKLVEQAKGSLSLRRTGANSIVPPNLAAAPAEGARRFGHGSAAWEIAEAVRRSLINGNQASMQIVALLDEITAKARSEISRLQSLEEAAANLERPEAFAALLAQAGLVQSAVKPLNDRSSSSPFADFRTIRHI